jgi:hypothetical protein
MNRDTIKAAYSKMSASDLFIEQTISRMIQAKIKVNQRKKANLRTRHLVLATVTACLTVIGVIFAWQAFGRNDHIRRIEPTLSIQPTSAVPADTQATPTETTGNQTTATYPKSFVDPKNYIGGLYSMMRPEQGEVIIYPDIRTALSDPDNLEKYYFVQILVIPEEQYANDFDDYLYNGRTISEWLELVDLSNGTYPYSEYNGDHGGNVTLEEWTQKQDEAKTLSPQENLDEATELYNSNVLPILQTADMDCIESENTRLSELGYDVSLSQTWTHSGDSEKEFYTILTGLLTQEQILEFSANEKFGYFIDWVHDGDGIVNYEE